VATTNVGAAGTITVGASTPGVALPVDLFVCQTDPASGACLGSPAASVTLEIATGATPTFAIFAAAQGPIPFDPAVNRVVVAFTEDGVSRGSTSVAIRTLSAGGAVTTGQRAATSRSIAPDSG